MPSATILSPRTGDTVNINDVTISVAYADFGSTPTALNCKIHDSPDTPEDVTGDGLHIGTTTTSASPAQQEVITFTTDENNPLNSQPDVNVTSGDTPNPIDEPEVRDEEAAAKATQKKL